jgi:hypothetical protein
MRVIAESASNHNAESFAIDNIQFHGFIWTPQGFTVDYDAVSSYPKEMINETTDSPSYYSWLLENHPEEFTQSDNRHLHPSLYRYLSRCRDRHLHHRGATSRQARVARERLRRAARMVSGGWFYMQRNFT